jgi:lipid-A-disaccharide synthase
MNRGGLLLVAGEASGDLHGARMLTELRRLVPGLEVFGLGGAELARAGQEQIADVHEISVIGIAEAAKILPRAKGILDEIVAACDRRRPAAAVLIDFPEFNLRLARRLKWLGVPVLYYISPQVWAWRKSRVRTIAELVDKMLVLFAFEEAFYREHGIRAVHVGHPLVDEVPSLPQAWDGEPRAQPLRELRIALLPGSRRSEVRALLPRMIGAIRELRRAHPEHPVAPRLILSPSLDEAFVRGLLEGEPLEIVAERRFEAIADSHLALCASGTATLEVGLLGTPMIVLYRLHPWSLVLAKLLVRLPHFSLVNLVLGRRAVPELLQGETDPARVAAEAWNLVSSVECVRDQRGNLAELRLALGQSGASLRAAREIAASLPGKRAA